VKLAVLQSNYIPWKGYFDIIRDVDLFIFYDDVQYTKNDWRNRNKLKMPGGAAWVTIPTGGDINHRVCDVRLADARWQRNHWKTIVQNYSKAPHFGRYKELLEGIYLGQSWETLSELNRHLIVTISREVLGLGTQFRDSRDYRLSGQKLDRLLDLVKQSGALSYLSGPSAQSYIEESRFAEIGVELKYKSYQGYPEYPQFYPPFEHGVSVLDLLFHTGPDAGRYIWGWRDAEEGVL